MLSQKRVPDATFAVGRSVWKLPLLERQLLKLTRTHPYEGFISKLPPLWTSYKPGTLRRAVRYGINLELDLSELAGWYTYWGFQNPDLDTVLDLCRPGMTVVDAGAHMGLFTLSIAKRVGAAGHVHAVEPDPVSYRELLRHLAINPEITWVTTHNVALADSRQTLHLGSPLPHNRSCRISDTGEAVQAVTLDDLGIRPDFVKMDIEGYETRALRGATQTLASKPTLFVEVQSELLREAGSSSEELLGVLAAHGYRLVDNQTGQPPSPEAAHTDVILSLIHI